MHINIMKLELSKKVLKRNNKSIMGDEFIAYIIFKI